MKWLHSQLKMYKRYKKRQSGGALPLFALSAALPLAKAALPFLGKAALGGAASFGVGKILGKRKTKRKRRYKRYVR